MTHPNSLRFACEGVEKMRGLVVFLLAFLLVGCGASLNKFRTTNRQNLNRLSVGMSKNEVHQVMGNEPIKANIEPTGVVIYGINRINNPYRSETFKGKDGKNYAVLFYYTDEKNKDHAITDDELTPIVLLDDKVVGWGWGFLNDSVSKYHMQIDVR